MWVPDARPGLGRPPASRHLSGAAWGWGWAWGWLSRSLSDPPVGASPCRPGARARVSLLAHSCQTHAHPLRTTRRAGRRPTPQWSPGVRTAHLWRGAWLLLRGARTHPVPGCLLHTTASCLLTVLCPPPRPVPGSPLDTLPTRRRFLKARLLLGPGSGTLLGDFSTGVPRRPQVAQWPVSAGLPLPTAVTVPQPRPRGEHLWSVSVQADQGHRLPRSWPNRLAGRGPE